MKTTTTILTGWVAIVFCMSPDMTNAAPWPGAEALVGTAAVSQASPPGNHADGKRQQADDLLRRARQAMAENDFAAAEALVSKAEALGVTYNALSLGDNPKKLRHELDRKRTASKLGPTRPSQLFAQLPLQKKEAAPIDPFASRSSEAVPSAIGDTKALAQSYIVKSRSELVAGNLAGASHWYRMAVRQNAVFGADDDSPAKLADDIRRAGGDVTAPSLDAAAADTTPNGLVAAAQSPFGRDLATMPSGREDDGLPAALKIGRAAEPVARPASASKSSADPLLEARRVLAVGDWRRAATLVAQAKANPANYDPLGDTPERVEAAIRQCQDLSSQPKNTEAYRRAYARMMLDQAEALLRAHDYDLAERLADEASRQRVSYATFEANPEQLLKRIDAARKKTAAPAPSATPGVAHLESPGERPVPAADGSPVPAEARQRAVELTRQARQALKAGQIQQAQQLAEQAEQLGVPDSVYGANDDRPGLVLLDIRTAGAGNPLGTQPAGNRVITAATGPLTDDRPPSRALYDAMRDPTRNVPAAYQQRPSLSIVQASDNGASDAMTPSPGQERSNVLTAAPEDSTTDSTPGSAEVASPSTPRDPAAQAMALFRQGEEALTAHNKEAAYRSFQQAAVHKRHLDAATAQRLQDYLQLLSIPATPRQPAPPSRSLTDEAIANQQVLARQVAAQVAQQESNAKKMLPTDPKGALALLEETRRGVEAAGLEPGYRTQLLARVDRHLAETRQFVEQNRPRIELDEKNKRTRDEVDREKRLKVEVQEKLALMVDDFNRKMDEQRYEEAEVVAKRAAELDPENPLVQQLQWQAKFVRRVMKGQSIRAEAENGFVRNMESIDEAGIPFDDREPIRFPDVKDWSKLTNIRSRQMREQARNRSERELEIERRLRTPVSISFKNEPLANVLDVLAKQTGVNLHLDPQALAEYGIASDTPITIDLRNEIMLKSALNLILEPLHLSYVVKDEVLKITSEQQRQGEVYVVMYPVADLIMPIPNFVPGPMGLASAYRDAMGNVGYGGGNPFGTPTTPLAVVASKKGDQGSAMVNPALLAQMSGSVPAGNSTNVPFGAGPGGLGGGSQADFDALIDLITSTIEPTSWDDVGGPGSIAEFEGNLSLVISQTQEVHEEIVDLLEQLRRMQDLQVTIEVRFITLNDNFFERIGVDFDFDINDRNDRPFQVFGRQIAGTGDPATSVEPTRNTLDVDYDRSTVAGLAGATLTSPIFSADLDIPFRQNSFGLAVPQFGGFDPGAGASLGFAILSDIEAFFFINAAQGDRRSNVLQAPKVTLFNGQQAFVSDTSQSPFVVSVIPVVGDFAAAQQPVIVVLSEGTFMTVQAVVSNDRRFVRLTVVPFFSKIGKVDTFRFTGETTTTTDTSADGWLNPTDPNDTRRNKDAKNTTTSSQGTTVQLPTFSFVTVTTTVSVPDGGTVLLGGIKRLSEGRSEFGVPMLDKIPYVNRLFKNVGIGRETQSLMMMVTPRIIIQEEEEEKLGILPPP